jgi:hypothetical protein
MTRELVQTPIESKEYEFVLIKGLKEENAILKEAINDVLDVLIDGNGVPNMVWVKNRLLQAVNK